MPASTSTVAGLGVCTALAVTLVVTPAGPATAAAPGHAGPPEQVAAAAAAPATAASDLPRDTAFTAAVTSIDHGLGVVRLSGTAPAGSSVEIGGDVVAPVSAEAGTDGQWTATVHCRSGERVLTVTSAATGEVVELPVDLLVLTPPGMIATVDGIARTIALEGTGYPRAHFVIEDDGVVVGETDADDTGAWAVTLRDLAFGRHHIAAWQYFDGTHNGGVDEVYTVSGNAVVAETSASRQTERIVLSGRAAAGTILTFADRNGPVTDPDGHPVTVAVDASTAWTATLPIPADARFETVTVTTRDGDVELGTTDAHVTVPLRLTATAEERADGTVRLAGTGEIGGEVVLEDETGEPVTGTSGAPVSTTIGRSWSIVMPRRALPATGVVAQQRVDGVDQGTVRLALSALPGGPEQPEQPGPAGPGDAGGPGSAGGPGAPTATDRAGGHDGAAATTTGAVARSGPRALAFTGAEIGSVLAASAALLLAGGAVLLTGAVGRRRRGVTSD